MEIYMKKLFPVLLALCLVFTGCKGSLPGNEKLNVTSDEIQFAQPQQGDTVAEITTDKGVIKAVLFPDIAPKAVASFTHLANGGYFDGITFHRAIEDMLVQSGSFDGSRSGGKSAWELEFEDEFSDQLHHYNGALSMANHGEDTNGSQFFFVTAPIGSVSDETAQQMSDAGWRTEVQDAYKQAGGLPSLDWRYTVFGQIYDGLGVAYDISRVKTDADGKPVDDVLIQSVKVYTVE